MSPLVERALRAAAECHRDQCRKASQIPYITHPFAVAWTLFKHGWQDDVTLAAALLHDVLEDTTCTVEELRDQFPDDVVTLVLSLSEQKTDGAGVTRSWEDRKRDHLAVLREAPLAARAISLADKLHNLESIRLDLDAGGEVWGRFNAPRARVLWYHRAMVETCDQGESPLRSLSAAVSCVLNDLETRV